jgi:phage recombination protein Bet
MEKSIVKATESAAIELTPKTIKAYINQYATDQEIALFLNQCSMFQLNPFKREIYLIKYSTNQPATFVVGYETYLKRAERTDKWAGMESGTEDDPKTGKPLKAWAKVYRKDWAACLYHEVYLDEYIQKTKEGEPTRFWKDKPRTMLKKVAIGQAFRMAFPDEFAGMPYTAEEMPVDHAKLPSIEVVPEVNVDPIKAELEADGQVVNETAPKTSGKFAHLAAFTQAKKTLGNEAYYQCLGEMGYEHANQIPEAVRPDILEEMRLKYKDLKKSPAEHHA